ncbi:hypothetical protein ACLMJK_003210 [Lecanora helva]
MSTQKRTLFGGFRKQELTLIPLDEVERALVRLCTPPPRNHKSRTRPPISDKSFQHISDLLEHLQRHREGHGWDLRPRTYTVLRSIGRVDLMSTFIALGLTDYSFPYSWEKLPVVLHDDTTRDKFMEAQSLVFTEAMKLESDESDAKGVHAYIQNGQDFYHVLKHLGSGGYGSVDCVYSKLSLRRYARKQFMRKKTPIDDQCLLKKFEDEILKLKSLHHHHLVCMVGSYTDQRSVAFLMEPIGECNLMTYLCTDRAFIENHLPSLRNYFGCLASAVAYLHRQRVRHRDLKPQNIIIKDHMVYITDFGNALDWSKKGRDTTNDPIVPFTEQYVAPEIAKRTGFSRSSTSDVWSLGVVFLDMITVLRGSTIRALHNFLKTHGTRHPCVWGNAPASNEWFEKIRQITTGPELDNEPLMWIKDMTQKNPANRPLAGAIVNQIRNTAGRGHFIGQCCAVDDDFEEYLSPSLSQRSNEDFNLNPEDAPPMLDLGEKPYGSFVKSSQQNNIESWLVENNSSPEYTSVSYNQIQDEDFHVPYSIVYDGPTTSSTNCDQEWAHDQRQYVKQSMVLDQCEGYDIVQDESDEEDGSGLGDQMYEIVEDCSSSEASTIRQVQSIDNINVTSMPLSRDSGLSIDEASNEIEAQLDALPEDPIVLPQLEDPNGASAISSAHLGTNQVLRSAGSNDLQTATSSVDIPRTEPRFRFLCDYAAIYDITKPDTLCQKLEAETANHTEIAKQDSLSKSFETESLERPSDVLLKKSMMETKVDSLNAANLAKHTNDMAEPLSITEERRQKVKRKFAKNLEDKLQISPSSYMQEVWEAASSAPTSLISEKTKAVFARFGSGLAWQDKSANFLEKYAKLGKAAATRRLLEVGCNPGTRAKPRIRPLMLAVKGGSPQHNKCVQALLAAGADVNARELGGRTALHYAIEHENFHGYTNLIRDLLEAGADPNIKDKSGDFPLLQILYGGYEPLQKHRRDALACLLQPEFATDVNVLPPGTRNMPLHLAVRRKDPWAVSMLISKGATVDQPNGSGMTPLMLAASSWSLKMMPGEVEILRFLLEGGVEVNEQDTSGKSALHYAASVLSENAVRLLLERGANPHMRDNKKKRPQFYASWPREKIKKAREVHGNIMQLLFEAMRQNDLASRDNECAVVTAVLLSHIKDARQLFKMGASAKTHYESIERTPLLHVALRNQNQAMARLLVDKGAPLTQQNKDGQDALAVLRSMTQNEFTKSFHEYLETKDASQNSGTNQNSR